jgi:hypothetical protein
MGNFLGIDMGASYVKAVYTSGATSELFPVLNKDGDCMFRVCGIRRDDGTFKTLTKEEARKAAIEKGAHPLENVKALRGEGKGGEELEIAVLKEVLECYRRQTGNFDLSKVDRVTLSHPVSHRPNAVEALKRIAAEAGLPEEKLDTIEEPVAIGLFAKHLRPNLDGTLFVVDAGHYTTDLVTMTMERGDPVITSANYLSLRLGVAEICHRLGRSVWLKMQMAAGAPTPTASPFDEAGPEDNNALVQKLSAWAEERVVRAMDIDFFGPDTSTYFTVNILDGTGGLSIGPWREKINVVHYQHNSAGANQENLARLYAHHRPEFADRIRAQNYRDATRPLVNALCAAAMGVLLEIEGGTTLNTAIGGGMSLIPEVRDALTRVISCRRLPAPIDLKYDYTGLGALPVARLLSVASGAAIASSQRYVRRDTLSDTVGILVWYELEDALSYLDGEHLLPADFDPASDAALAALSPVTTPHHVVIVPLHRVLAQRGVDLPLDIPFPDDLVVFSRGGTINLTRYGDQHNDALPIAPAAKSGSGIVAQVKVPRPHDPESALRLSIKIRRNDVWELSIRDEAGREVVTQEVALNLVGRSERAART